MKITKTIPFFLSALFFIQCSTNKTSKNILLSPKEWNSKVIEFPLEFAPSIQYSGREFTSFLPNYDKQGTPSYFSYVFLWEINQNPALSTKKIELELETYFDGLLENALEKGNSLPSKITKSKAFFEKINDSKYVGKVLTFDAIHAKKPLSLNIILDYSFCSKQNNHLLFFKVSPQDLEHQIWKKLKKVSIDSECE
ncbi:hypothetical protein [Aquimarina pacifica]|uniref:hypothetical protein n=1 Tax=Aquimarina pacifica TaxID=1296415 RepID=UPI000471C0D0|nr:hypothetical protein [Aquimarina pacifica]